jgi:hypothetical protein
VSVRTWTVRLGISLALWVGTIILCFLYSYVHPSSLGYAALALLYLWYVYVPIIFVLVSVVSSMSRRRSRRAG